MAKRLHNLQKLNEKKFYNKDEEEIFNYDYERTSDTHPIAGVNSSIKLTNQEDSSKENVELSLEVEIADSLKHLIASPERQNSDLLDVTIVRPTDLDFVKGLDTNNILAFKNTEVRNLIASMEREKQYKKKLIEECKKKALASKINTINETTKKNNAGSNHTLGRNEERELHKRRLKRTENATCSRNITAMSAPPNVQLDYKINKMIHTPENLKYNVGEAYSNSAPIAILKPLVGEIKESLKHLEASITQIGDGSSNSDEMKQYDKRFTVGPGSSISKDALLNDDKNYMSEASKDKHQHTHQVYAAANNYSKLRKLLACQNAERKNQDNEKPCLCQHCGMVGLLMESEKRPIMHPSPIKRPDTGWPKNEYSNKIQKLDHDPRKELPRNPHDKSRMSDDNFWIFRDLASRLEALEIRVAAQEQRAVPKDYFKRIINKLWHRHASDSLQTMPINNVDRNQHFKDNSTQYSTENLESMLKAKKETKTVKHRNVQIQQNTKRNFCVNPVLVTQPDIEHQTQVKDSQELESNKSVGTKTINAISDFFTKKSETIKKGEELNTPREKSSPMESFWRWGEEIIKPGFDLKIKIMSLLDERFQNAKNTNELDSKTRSSKTPGIKINSTKTNSVQICSVDTKSRKPDSVKPKIRKTISTSTIHKEDTISENIFDTPLPFEDKETQKNKASAKTEENVNFTNSSSRTLKKMLDIMSEKIYKDHVKPTVDAIKQEQKSFNNENTKQIYNIKAAMDAAFCKINTQNISNTSTALLRNEAAHESQEWQKDFFEPLEVPISLKNVEGNIQKNSKPPKLLKKSAIPIRINNPSPTTLGCDRNIKYSENRRSLIPCLKMPLKDWSDGRFRSQNNKPGTDKTQKKEKHDLQHKYPNTRKHHTTDKSKKDKRVQIKYINPKVDNWNEESGASIEADPSAEDKQMLLTDKYHKVRDNNTQEKRRISHKHSVTDKLAFLTKLTKAEMGKVDIWNNILKQVKNHCRSKQDTVIIQIPSKTHRKRTDTRVTEVEFTIEDIEKLATCSKLNASFDNMPQKSVDSNNMESFLLIRSRKILEEVHKRLETSFQKR